MRVCARERHWGLPFSWRNASELMQWRAGRDRFASSGLFDGVWFRMVPTRFSTRIRLATGSKGGDVRVRGASVLKDGGGEEAVIHYSLWFWLRDGASQQDAMHRINSFLIDQKNRNAIEGFTLLRNRAPEGKTQLGPFQALIVFATAEQFAAAFQEIARTGIHSGSHGEMVELVSRFHAETFDVIDESVGL
jgi:hypothetical protein